MQHVDETYVIHQEGQKQMFLDHIYKADPAIKFTVECNKENGAIPILDTIVKPEADNTLSFTVYRKPAHIDQYLQGDSHYNLVAKYSVISTLIHRTRTVCTKPELLKSELQHLRKALAKCKYPKLALDKIEGKFINRGQEESNTGNTQVEPSEHDSNNPSDNNTGSDTAKDKYNKGP